MLQWLFGSRHVVTVDQDFRDRICQDMVKLANANARLCDLVEQLHKRIIELESKQLVYGNGKAT